MLEKINVSIDKITFDKIIYEIKALSVVCMDEYVKNKLIELNKKLEEINDNQIKVNVEEQISNKMEEVKGKDSELSARLYILYQDLKRKKLSEDEALEIFDRYVRHVDFDKMIY